MVINELLPLPDYSGNAKMHKAHLQLNNLLTAMKKKDIPDRIVAIINAETEKINAVKVPGSDFHRKIRAVQTLLIKLLEKELKIVPQNHYRNQWLALGMAAFGIPLGVAFGASLKNMAFIGIGIPIGMAVGMAVGSEMDRKAFKEGRQLDIEIK
ncbi:hypothetical protein ACE01N_01990 [Saccharicrinis sp. FJH2]|uniref:hypothetical protein n=1 Tax=Saccharicrinis sp. FJH65 TaxID=3344659 RepID=UPI0035F348F7